MSRFEAWLAGDRATRWMAFLTVLLLVVTMVLAGLTIPDIASNTEASRRTDDLNGCRASYRSAIDDANVVVFDAYGVVQDRVGEAVVAAIRQDPTQLALIAAEIELAVESRQVAIDELYAAAEAYDQAVELSRNDPDAFLADCRTGV